MGEVVALPVSSLRKLATLWQDEERAFETVLDVLRENRRFDLVLKLDTFQRVRHKRMLRLLMKHVKDSRAPGASPDEEDAGVGASTDEGAPGEGPLSSVDRPPWHRDD